MPGSKRGCGSISLAGPVGPFFGLLALEKHRNYPKDSKRWCIVCQFIVLHVLIFALYCQWSLCCASIPICNPKKTITSLVSFTSNHCISHNACIVKTRRFNNLLLRLFSPKVHQSLKTRDPQSGGGQQQKKAEVIIADELPLRVPQPTRRHKMHTWAFHKVYHPSTF